MLLVLGLAFATALEGAFAFVFAVADFWAFAAGLLAPLVRVARFAVGFDMPSVIIRPFSLEDSQISEGGQHRSIHGKPSSRVKHCAEPGTRRQWIPP